jgi:hypothetical protein
MHAYRNLADEPLGERPFAIPKTGKSMEDDNPMQGLRCSQRWL